MNHFHTTDLVTKAPSARAWRRLSILTLALGLTACANMTGITPQSSLRDADSVGLQAQPPTGNPVNIIAAQWWKQLGDAQLNQLIDTALTHSPTLKVAQARLTKAQAQTQVAHAGSGPQLNAQVDVTRQRYTENGMVPAPLAGSVENSGTAQLNGSWELDFFGRHRAALEASIGMARAVQADAQAAHILLATEITRQYIALARLQGQLDVAQRAFAQRSETLDLVRGRVAAGLDTNLELRQSEGGLPETRQQIAALHEQVDLTRNAIAALVGQPTLAPSITPPHMAVLQPLHIPAELPADLLGRRADIVAARWRVEAAQQDIAYAKTQFYPNINLVAFAGFNSLGLDQLLQSSSRQWGIGPAIRLPIFESGRLRANLKGKTADYDIAVEQYNASVMHAVHNVSDQIVSARAIAVQTNEQSQAQTFAEKAYEIARSRYEAGLSNYLQVLSAETNVLAQRRQAIDLAARALDNQIQLTHALGGGYIHTQHDTY